MSAARHRQRTEPAVSYEVYQRRGLIENEINALSKKFGDGRRAAPVRYVLELDVCHVRKKLYCEMLKRSNTRCPIGQRGISRPCSAHEVCDRSDRMIGIRHQDVRKLRGHADHRKICDGTIGKLAK